MQLTNGPAADLQHLRVLRVLLEERHVSRAADRLEMTQSAVSKSLRRLRQQFDDPLLIRSPGGYQLSHKARMLEPALHDLLERADQLFLPPIDRLEDLDTQFRLSMADDIAILLLPRILQRLSEVAPRVTVAVSHTGELDKLRSGAIDFCIEAAPERGSGFYARPLFHWSWCCIMAADNPLTRRTLTVERYVAASHGLVSFSGEAFGRVDEALGTLELTRRLTLIVPYFSAVPYAVQDSDTIFTLPRPLGERFAADHGLVLRPVPLDMPPLAISLIWHHRNQYDSVHRWFRQFLLQELSETEAIQTHRAAEKRS